MFSNKKSACALDASQICVPNGLLDLRRREYPHIRRFYIGLLAPQFGHSTEAWGTKSPQYLQGIIIIALLKRSFSSSIRSIASSCSLLLFILRDCRPKTTIVRRIAAPKKIPKKAMINVKSLDMNKT